MGRLLVKEGDLFEESLLLWRNEFSDEPDGKTIVTMISNHDSLDEIEQIIAMGFKEGIKVCLDQLEILLAK